MDYLTAYLNHLRVERGLSENTIAAYRQNELPAPDDGRVFSGLKDFEAFRHATADKFDNLTFQERVNVLDHLGARLTWSGSTLKASVYTLYGCNVNAVRNDHK